jgi:hypothetical protein
LNPKSAQLVEAKAKAKPTVVAIQKRNKIPALVHVITTLTAYTISTSCQKDSTTTITSWT